MSNQTEKPNHKYKFLHNKHVTVWIWSNASMEVNIHHLGKEEFEDLAALFGKPIKEDEGTRWFELARNRGGTKITFFEGR